MADNALNSHQKVDHVMRIQPAMQLLTLTHTELPAAEENAAAAAGSGARWVCGRCDPSKQ